MELIENYWDLKALIDTKEYHPITKLLSGIGRKLGDKRYGQWRFYHLDGETLYQEGTYNDSGEKTGIWKRYTVFGDLCEISTYQQNLLSGPCSRYEITKSKSGDWELLDIPMRLIERGHYQNDKQEGKWEIYHKNGTVEMTGSFRSGKRTGYWYHYCPYGRLKSMGPHDENGDANGLWIFYDPRQNKLIHKTFVNGKLINE